MLATRFGVAAAELVRQRRFGRMVALQGNACGDVALAQVAGRSRRVPEGNALLRAAEALGLCLG